MAEQLWNKVNIPFPSAASVVRFSVSQTSDTTLQQIPEAISKVNQLLHSRLLQTDIRVLYELLYVLNNSFRQQKSFRALKQVEQCINRLKEMKLDSALRELLELCPSQAQRQVASDSKGDINVPSQPALEWFCLKVLGAGQLMGCVLKRCTRAFLLSQQHLQSEEFIILNVVLTSMLSRLWVYFRGILTCLAPLYEQILKLWKDVSKVQQMPYLRDFSLPTDLAEFMGPSDYPLSGMEPAPENLIEGVKTLSTQDTSEQRKKTQIGLANSKNKEVDLGTVVTHQRKYLKGFDIKALLKKTRRDSPETSLVQGEQLFSRDVSVMGQKRMFVKKIQTTTTFSDMAVKLMEMIKWCKSTKHTEERRRLSFLYLKCKRMKRVESAERSVQRKLKSFRQEVYWALLLRSVPRTCLSLTALWRTSHHKVLFRPRRTLVTSSPTGGCKRRFLKVRRKRPVLSLEKDPHDGLKKEVVYLSNTSADSNLPERTAQEPSCMQNNDIDDIFASIGF